MLLKPLSLSYMSALMVILFLLTVLFCALFSVDAKAIDLDLTSGWYNISGISHHTHTSTQHNAYNYGIGYEWNYYGRNVQVGIYNNSFWKTTTFVTAELMSFKVTDDLRFRFNGGLVTGYKYAVQPMVIPVWTYEQKHWGMDIMTIPSISGRQGIYAAQLKLRF